MQLDFIFVLSNLLSLFLLIACGFAAVRMQLIPREASPAFSSLLLKFALPCTIFVSLTSKEYNPAFLVDSIVILLLGLLLYFVFLFSFSKLAVLAGVRNSCRGIWTFGGTFANNGFMGFPIILALLGPEGLSLAVILNIAFNLSVYTIGAMAISRDSSTPDRKIELKKVMLSPINAAIVLSLLFYFGRLPIPALINAPLVQLANITTPLSMFITGMALAQSRAGELLSDKDAYSCTFLRLIICPLLTLFILRLLPLPNPLILPVVVLSYAMPTPSVMTVLTETYQGNTPFAAKIAFLTNIASLASIPLICMLL